MKKFNLLVSVGLYILAFSVIGYYFAIEYFVPINGFNLTPFDRLTLLIAGCLPMYFAARIIHQSSSNHTTFFYKFNLVAWLIIYLLTLATLTLFDDYSYRDNFGEFNHYISRRYNFIPFNTIQTYTSKYFDGYTSFEVFFYNIFGNILALMPLGFLLPLIFKHQNNFLLFLLTTLIITIGIEVIQYITISGTCDVDDVFLNTLGACLVFLILQIKPIKSLIHKLFLGQTLSSHSEANPASE